MNIHHAIPRSLRGLTAAGLLIAAAVLTPVTSAHAEVDPDPGLWTAATNPSGDRPVPVVQYDPATGLMTVKTTGLNGADDTAANGNAIGGDDVGMISLIVAGPAANTILLTGLQGTGGAGTNWSGQFFNGKMQIFGGALADAYLLSIGSTGVFQYPAGLTPADFGVVEMGINFQAGMTGDTLFGSVQFVGAPACCLPDLTCAQMPIDDCVAAGGIPREGLCADAGCDMAGGCCLADDVCFYAFHEECLIPSGTFLGEGTTCSAAECADRPGCGQFEDDVLVDVLNQPRSVAMGDLDGINGLDLAIVHRDGDDVSVLLNNGDGTFTITGPYDSSASSSTSVAIGDLDHDGHLDLAVSSDDSGAAAVAVMLNNGDGTFAAGVTYAAGVLAQSVAIDDLDRDGDLDLAVTGEISAPGDVSVLLNNGDGTFAAFVPYEVGDDPRSVAIGDIDGVNGPDLVVANFGSDTVSVLLNNGNGTFMDDVPYNTDDGPISVAVGDLDGVDGPDLVVAIFGNGKASLFFNEGDGTFGAEVLLTAPAGPTSVAIGDLDGDSDLDFAVADAIGEVLVFINPGGGSFFAVIPYETGDESSAVALGDLDGDLDLDLAVTNLNTDSVSILLQVCPEACCLPNGACDILFADECTAAGGIPRKGSCADAGCDLAGACCLGPAGCVYLFPEDCLIPSGIFLGPGTTCGAGACDDLPGCGLFAPDVTYGVGTEPTSVAIGDLNGDLALDLVVANESTNDVSVLLNNGDGTFAPDVTYGAGSIPVSVAIGDLNGDLALDLAVANQSSNDVSVLLNNGDGTFAPDVTYGTGSQPFSVAIGDLDGDLDLDLAVANVGTGDVSVLLNNGDGTFTPDGTYGAGAEPFFVAIGDLDGDLALDLAVVNIFSTDVSVLLNNGDGTFASDVTYDAGTNPRCVAIGDLNGDLALDLAVGNATGSDVSVLLNNGDGTFAPDVTYGAGASPRSVAIGDLDGDLDLDLAVGNANSNDVSVLLNNGDGTFAPDDSYDVGAFPLSVAIGDLDGDLDLDLAVVNFFGDDVSVLLQDCPIACCLPTGGCGLMLAGDCTAAGGITRKGSCADAGCDLAGACCLGPAGCVYLFPEDCLIPSGIFLGPGTTCGAGACDGLPGCGFFAPDVTFGAGTSPASVAIGDLDGDLDLDLAVANRDSDDVSVLLNNGDGTFAPHVTYGTGTDSFSVAIGDLDGDLDLDLAVANPNSNDVSVLLNNGDGTFAPDVTYGAGAGPSSVAIGDLDGDLDLDLAVANFFGNGVSALLNNGDGTFAPPVTYGAGTLPNSVAIGDLDGDLDLDLALANFTGDGVSVLLNNGDGTFAPDVTYGAGTNAASVAIGDLDGDLDLDLAVANDGSDDVSVLLNNGDGTFAAHVTFDAGANAGSVAIGDLDGDLDLDLAVANFNGDDVSVLLNNGDATFAPDVTYGAGTNATSVAIGDLDGDLDLDLAVANFSSNDVSVLLQVCPEVSIADASESEATGQVGFTILLSAPAAVDVTVEVTTGDGSAMTSDNDYTALTSFPVTIPAGATSSDPFFVSVTNDNTVELDEAFTVSLGNASPPNTVILPPGTMATGTIENDDQAVITIADVTDDEGDSGTTKFDFMVSMSNDVDVPVTMSYSTRANSATVADDDYSQGLGVVVFPPPGPAPQDQLVRVFVQGDTKFEPTEQFFVDLHALDAMGRNVIFGDPEGRGVIRNDDALINGACCFENGVCADLIPLDCVTAGGAFQGTSTLCFQITCPQPATGACCFFGGECFVSSEFDCGANGGFYQGDATPCAPGLCVAGSTENRASGTDKGSLLFIHAVEVRWSCLAGNDLLQDTFISITNDFPEDVQVQMYFINGDPPADPVLDPNSGAVTERAHTGWNWVDNAITLTGNEATYWSAFTGLPKGVSPFEVLDPGDPPGRPALEDPTERVLRGYIIAWAVNNEGQEIRWNHLSAAATVVKYDDTTAWEYGATTIAVANGAGAHGEATGSPGELRLDGTEYVPAYAELLMNFQAAMSGGFSSPEPTMFTIISDTDLTVHPVSADLRQTNEGPVTTKASFDVWNENETKFSGMHRCVTCWDQALISDFETPNHFLRMFLQTDHGKTRINGVRATQCDDVVVGTFSREAAILGVHVRQLAINGGADLGDGSSAAAGGNLHGLGFEPALIRYDATGDPPDEAEEGEEKERPSLPLDPTKEEIDRFLGDFVESAGGR